MRRCSGCGPAYEAPPARSSATELSDDEIVRAMEDTIDNGGYDFMSKDDW
ncbi:hypothetical protein [Micromonospora sp. ALFpr18c]|nr:hypothetical protein [Micromonospora sp. ALFpr18c]